MSTFSCSKRQAAGLATLLLALSASGMAQTGSCGTVIPGNPLPDLIVDANLLRSVIVATTERFATTSCGVVEGCVSSKGTHDLLRFTAAFANVGQGDLVIGDPNQCPSLYQLSQCHGHFHLIDSAAYRLWTELGYQQWALQRDAGGPANSPTNEFLLNNALKNGDLIVGRKQGFCMMDSARYTPTAPAAKFNLCGGPGAPGNQGISVGWEDIYGQQLDCQWIEIDHLRAGRYVLEVQTNPDHTLPEANYSNNYGAVLIDFTPSRGSRPAQVTILSGP